MLHRYTLLSLATIAATIANGANAGTIAANGWSPGGCGSAPAAFKLDLSDPDAYNKSVEGVNTYRKNSRDYVDCLAQEANKDIQTIAQSAKVAQQAALDADAQILSDVKAADQKFGK